MYGKQSVEVRGKQNVEVRGKSFFQFIENFAPNDITHTSIYIYTMAHDPKINSHYVENL